MNGLLFGIFGLIAGMFSGSMLFDGTGNEDAPQQPVAVADVRLETVLKDDYVSMQSEVMQLQKEGLTSAEVEGLLFMREEEKLARDVYQTLYEQWDNQIFANIAQSEQTHTEAVRQLLDKYGIEDPVKDDSVGVFTNPEFQTLYVNLTAQGKQSEQEALKVGALIEDLDIKDLTEQLAQTDNADIKVVYENLQRGSRNHLRAFTKQLAQNGIVYEPEYISTSEYETITQSEQERGSTTGWGGMKRNR